MKNSQGNLIQNLLIFQNHMFEEEKEFKIKYSLIQILLGNPPDQDQIEFYLFTSYYTKANYVKLNLKFLLNLKNSRHCPGINYTYNLVFPSSCSH